MRRLAALSLIPLAAGVLAACSPEHAGAAATVGEHRIELTSVRSAVDAAYTSYESQTGSTKPSKVDFQRTVLQRQITRLLDDAMARELGVHVPDSAVREQISTFEQQNGGHKALVQAAAAAGVGADDIFPDIRDTLLRNDISTKLLAAAPPSEQQVQAYYAANPAQFASDHVAHILVAEKDQALANQIAGQIKADPSRFAALAKQYSIDTSNKDNGGDLGTQAKGAYVQQFEDAIFKAKPGDYIGPVHTQFGWHIIHVISLTNLTLDQARPQILQTLSAPTSTYTESLYGARLLAEARRQGVHVSSRFGSWSAKQGGIVAPGSDTATALSTTGRTDTVPVTPDLTGAQPTTTP